MTRYTVEVTKRDGAQSIYFVLALSLGGAENTVLKEVYNAQFALASYGWPSTVAGPDLFSRGAAIQAIRQAI